MTNVPHLESESRTIRLPLGRDPDQLRIFVIRGDLRSITGYGRATQALARLLSERFEVIGVDLHPNPADAGGHFPYPIIQDSEIPKYIVGAKPPPIILTYSTPDTYIYYPGAINIGSLYWETEAIPFKASWNEFVQCMDYFWAPTTFVAEFVRRCGYTGPISIITWPHDLQPITNSEEISGLEADFVATMTTAPNPPKVPLSKLRNRSGHIFLAIQSLAPRKGLPILLSEWRDYVGSRSTEDLLLLKLRFIHSSRIRESPIAQLKEMLQDAGFRHGESVSIAIISEDLSDNATQALYVLADVCISASYGEGFGGSVAEGLCHNRLVIAPRHTGMSDLLSPDYPLTVQHMSRHVALRGLTGIYPYSSQWRLPRRGGLRSAIEAFSAMSHDDRRMALSSARSYLSTFCSEGSVRTSLSAFFEALNVAEACECA